MSQILEVRTKDDGAVNFDISDSGSVGTEQVGRRDRIVKPDFDLDHALTSVTPAARAVIDAFRSLHPDDVTVQFGIRVDAQAGGIIGKVGAAGHITVTAHWSGPSA